LILLACYLHIEEPDLKLSEIFKIVNSGLVIIGIIYSVFTYESNQVKNLHEIRIRKSSATYNVMREWHISPMLDYSKICKEFESKHEYKILHSDIETFMIQFNESVN
jgi:hypothetical protein